LYIIVLRLSTQPGTLAYVEPLGSHSIVETIYRTLRQEIATGNLPPGARLHQAELAEQLGTSRTPVREALAHLASDRLVEFQPNRGYFVATMSESRTRAAVEARLTEPLIARLAAGRRPPDPLARMAQAIEDEKRAPDSWAAYEASRDFHLALADASENEFFQRLTEQLWMADLGRPLYQAYVNVAGSDWIAGDAAEHEQIYRAIADGDEDAAERAALDHLTTAGGYLDAVVDVARANHPSGRQ
jgi:DNA-binding GntR family transcriptional regulator